jgi:hypothetical protein
VYYNLDTKKWARRRNQHGVLGEALTISDGTGGGETTTALSLWVDPHAVVKKQPFSFSPENDGKQ